jgi:SAM-dependent methyltransferase
MDTHQPINTRRRLRSRGGTRRRIGSLKLNTDAVSAILSPIFSVLPKTAAVGQHNLTYGEIEWPALKFIAEQAEKMPGFTNTIPKGKFYDLGCGRGRAVLYMALTGLFENSIGIEVLPERISLAQQALTNLKDSIPVAGSRVRLYEASFMNPAFKYKDARVIYIANLCFDDQTQTSLFNKLNLEMPKGSLLFCLCMPSTLPQAFELVGKQEVPMTWNPSSDIYILRHL